MPNAPGSIYLLLRFALIALVLWLPPWWAAGRVGAGGSTPFFRLLAASGGALAGWLGAVNLLGRLTGSSIVASEIWIVVNAATTLLLLWRRPAELSLRALLATWRGWLPVVCLGVVAGLPQWLMAVSTPYWDEVASSAIHLTAPNQFAEGLFPPRHNAFPDLPLKYHYGSTMLAGTLVWLLHCSANVAIDVVSTALHLFIFLFVFGWLAQLGLPRRACAWGSFTVLLGGGLAWLYVPWLETYQSFPKQGDPALLLHRHDPTQGFWASLVEGARTPVFHLHNADGTNSNLPWDIVNQFQQHAVALGLALTLLSAWLLCSWLSRPRASPWWLLSSTFSFGLLFLGHAVFGATACVTAGLLLAARWLRRPTRRHFVEGVVFVTGVTLLAFAHGGVLSRGDGYGANLSTLTARGTLGYSTGGLLGFIHWNLAGFGLPLVIALVAIASWPRRRSTAPRPRREAFAFFAALLAVSYLTPQLVYYAYGGSGIEEFTEIAKFFFVAHLALGPLSAFAIASSRLTSGWILAPALAAMAVLPLVYVYAASFDRQGRWLGFYESPNASPIAEHLGRELGRLKQGNREVAFDSSWNEPERHDYLDELQVYGGSVFSVTPRRFERVGSFLVDATLVADRERASSRLARLRPGAAEEAGVVWYSTRAQVDLPRLPLVVRSRFDKLVAERILVEAARGGPRVLYRIAGPTARVDDGIERFWRPRVVAQARSGRKELAFHDLGRHELVLGAERVALPAWFRDDHAHVLAGRFDRGAFIAGRMADTYFARGARLADLVDYRGWYWSELVAPGAEWTKETRRWFWDTDVPLVADLDGDGKDEPLAWRRGTGEWLVGERRIAGPGPADRDDIPVVGRFLAGAPATLAIFHPPTGDWTLLRAGDDPARSQVTFQFGAPDDVLVPGDYDGDGIDEVVVWRPSNATWYRRDPATGAATSWKLGPPSCLPMPADYDQDGRVDVACWDPAARTIAVSRSEGRTVDRTLQVPPGSIPAFVNMY